MRQPKTSQVTTDKSFIYRATYTNENGIKSEQMFSIAVNADCTPTTVSSSIYCNDTWVGATEVTVPCGAMLLSMPAAPEEVGETANGAQDKLVLP